MATALRRLANIRIGLPATRIRSMSLMKMNGAMTPPTP